MATHSSILAWEIPWAEDPGGLPSKELQRLNYWKEFQFHLEKYSSTVQELEYKGWHYMNGQEEIVTRGGKRRREIIRLKDRGQ